MSLPPRLPVILCLVVAAGAHGQPALRVVPATDGSCVGVSARDGKPLYFAGTSGLDAIAIPEVSGAEGTLSFFFTPDWSPGDCTTHWLLDLKGDKLLIGFRKGYSAAISPDYCYVQTDPEGGLIGFSSEPLFRARQRHHYAIRWSAAKNRIQFVVDGEASGRSGKYKYDGPARLPATLTFYNMACGTFDDVRVYPRYLTVPEIVQVAGLKEPARYLQEQPPPRGAERPGRPIGASGTSAPTPSSASC